MNIGNICVVIIALGVGMIGAFSIFHLDPRSQVTFKWLVRKQLPKAMSFAKWLAKNPRNAAQLAMIEGLNILAHFRGVGDPNAHASFTNQTEEA